MANTINLQNLKEKQLKLWLESFDVILTDCDGVLWHDNDVIAQAPETINYLQSLGKDIYFVTNNGTKTRHDLWLKAFKMNFKIDASHIIAPTYSIAEYLKERLDDDQKVYVIGSPAIGRELTQLDIPYFGLGEDIVGAGKWVDMISQVDELSRNENVAAVVVGFDDQFSFAKMLKAASFLGSNNRCYFLATNSDAVHKYPKYCIPGTGAILKALETCVDREAKVMGKPNPLICEQLIKSGAINPERTLMIGDCIQNDVAFGKNCGFRTLLVGSGRYQWPAVEEVLKNGNELHIPDYYLPSLGDLKALM